MSHWIDWVTEPEAWIALLSLTALEIVLGVDNIIFISILVGRLPAAQRARARFIGLGLAMVMRIGLLLSLAWMMRLTEPLISVTRYELSGRDLILIIGGLFLLGKSVLEIHNSLEGEGAEGHGGKAANFIGTLVQIAIIDIVFSLDSVITAVGMVNDIP
jgi:predicted tellurium resistance membrane protein TerC